VGAEYIDEISDGVNHLTPIHGRYVAVYYQIKNETNQTLSVDRQFGGMVVLVDDRGVRWDRSVRGRDIVATQKGYDAGMALDPGAEITTVALFEVPADITGLGLVLPRDRLRIELITELD
jgi:hypothetical protein